VVLINIQVHNHVLVTSTAIFGLDVAFFVKSLSADKLN